MLDGESMVQTLSFKQLLEVVRGAFGGLPTPLVAGGGHERALTPLLVLLLARMVGSTFIGILVLLCLAFEVVEDSSNCLLARGVAGGDVEKLLG